MTLDHNKALQRIDALRQNFKDYNLDAVLIPRGDEWLGEFVAPYAERLGWLTGFSGSAGLALIEKDQAHLFTDPRYTIQARQQCDAELYGVINSAETSLYQWLEDNAEAGMRVGFDPWLHTEDECQKMVDSGIELVMLRDNPIDQIWTDQPERPATLIHNFPDQIAGDSMIEKCNQMAWMIKEIGVRWYILTQPDSIAWLLNIRSNDVVYIPVALSYLMIGENAELIWFVDADRLHDGVVEKIKHQGKCVHPDDMAEFLTTLREAENNISFGVDFKRSPAWFKFHFAEMGKEIINIKDPCLFPKSLKTMQEQAAIREAHIQDGVAVTRFLKWMSEEGGDGTHTEMSAANKLEHFRSLSPSYLGPSFPTISGFGSNGAIIHYRASEESDHQIKGNNLLLVDSGGQYHYGTTDITRTIAVGEASAYMKRHFTLVLKGMIAVSDAHFKDGTTGREIDALARQPLLGEGLNFAHGTGHGVGCFLAVHEHAANLSPRCEDALKPGMLVSNEPGYYEEGAYGIRIENLILCTFESGTDARDILKKSKSSTPSYVFETVTFAPIDTALIDVDLLSDQECTWLNAYHAETYDKLSPLLNDDERAWLSRATKAI